MRILVSIAFTIFLFTTPYSNSQVNIPENAKLDMYGTGWVCNRGFKKVGNGCQVMSPEEVEQQRIQMQMLAARAKTESREFFVDDERFTLSGVSRKCEVYRYSDNYGDVECSGSKYRVIERKCEAYFSGKYEKLVNWNVEVAN